jgi:hypothetical protein
VARIHVILSDDVIAAIDERVGERGRSRFLQQAAAETLARFELGEALDSFAGVLDERSYPQFRDQQSINQWVRAQRRTEDAP